MSSPSVRGWHQHPDDPIGTQRWFDGEDWSDRTTGGGAPSPPAGPSLQRGWHHRPEDPDGVQRWFEGRTWTDRTTGGVAPPTPVAAASTLPRGWHHKPSDPDGVQRWFDGLAWTDRTTGGAVPTSPRVPAAPRGWRQDPDDPPGVQRWWDGHAWTRRLTGGSKADREVAAARVLLDPLVAEPGPVGFTAPTTFQTDPDLLSLFPHGAAVPLPRFGDIAVCGDPNYFIAVASDGRPAAVEGEVVRSRWRLGVGAGPATAPAKLAGAWFGENAVYEGLLADGVLEILVLDNGLRGSIRPGGGSARFESRSFGRLPAGRAYGFWLPFYQVMTLTAARRAFGLTGGGFELWAQDVLPVGEDGRSVGLSSQAGDLARRVLFGVAEDHRRSPHPSRRAFGESVLAKHGLERFDGRTARELAVGFEL